MALTRTTLRAVVREIAETDSTEFSDTLLDEYSNRGFDDVIAREGDWKLFEVEYTFNTVANTRDYTLLTITTPDILTDVTLVTDNTTYNRALTHISYEEGLNVYHGGNNFAGVPMYWSIRDGATPKMNLWPKPSGIRSMTLTGYRAAAWASGASTEPDLTEPLKHVLVDYVLMCWYFQQEDLQMATEYRKRYEDAVQRQITNAQRSTQSRPLIFGGGRSPVMNEKGWREMTNRSLP